MRADGRCEACGCMVANGYEVVRRGRIYHTACDPRAVPATATEGAVLQLPRRTGYEEGEQDPLWQYTEEAMIQRLLS